MFSVLSMWPLKKMIGQFWNRNRNRNRNRKLIFESLMAVTEVLALLSYNFSVIFVPILQNLAISKHCIQHWVQLSDIGGGFVISMLVFLGGQIHHSLFFLFFLCEGETNSEKYYDFGTKCYKGVIFSCSIIDTLFLLSPIYYKKLMWKKMWVVGYKL